MVALVDALEAKEIVWRAPYAQDRRRNVVTFTEQGRRTFLAALAASDAAERVFLGTMDEAAAAAFRARLRELIGVVDGEG
jgi:DNA-binding MarR family transcriptional regulator